MAVGEGAKEDKKTVWRGTKNSGGLLIGKDYFRKFLVSGGEDPNILLMRGKLP
jgi:hypothetical protein